MLAERGDDLLPNGIDEFGFGLLDLLGQILLVAVKFLALPLVDLRQLVTLLQIGRASCRERV